jgi:hypothetical protein
MTTLTKITGFTTLEDATKLGSVRAAMQMEVAPGVFIRALLSEHGFTMMRGSMSLRIPMEELKVLAGQYMTEVKPNA